MRKNSALFGLAHMALAHVMNGLSAVHNEFATSGIRVTAYRGGGQNFNPKINRHTSQPHEHKREIARRLRQSQR
jgi:thiamine biosynthesis lipoprotein ApbE